MTHLKKYNIVKEIFILEIELGQKVLIPDLLSQSYLPLSFTFYDPIINIVQQRLSINKRNYSQVKKNINLLMLFRDDKVRDDALCVKESDLQSGFQRNKCCFEGLSTMKCHTDLQNSKYIQVSEHVDHFKPKEGDEDASKQ